MIVIWQTQIECDGTGGFVYFVEFPQGTSQEQTAKVMAGSTDGVVVAWVVGALLRGDETIHLPFAAWCERHLYGRSRKTQDARAAAIALGWKPETPRKGDPR